MSVDNHALDMITTEEPDPISFGAVPCPSSASQQLVPSDDEGAETVETEPPKQIVSRIDAIDLEPEKAYQKLAERTKPFRREASVTDHILVQIARWHESLFYGGTSQEELNDLKACVTDLETDTLSIIDGIMRLSALIELALTKNDEEYKESGVLRKKVKKVVNDPLDLTLQSEKMANLQERDWEVEPRHESEGPPSTAIDLSVPTSVEPGQESGSTSSSVGVTAALETVRLADD